MDDASKQAAISELRGVLKASGTVLPDETILPTLLELELWDVRRAAMAIQDDSTAERRRSGADDEEIARSFAARQGVSNFEVDDSEVYEGRGGGGGSTSAYESRTTRRNPGGVGLSGSRRPLRDRPGGMSIWMLVWSAITLPFSLAQSIFFLFARILRLRTMFSGLFGGSPGAGGRPGMLRTDPRICAERFVRELEEETGATSGAESTASSGSIGRGTSTNDDLDAVGPSQSNGTGSSATRSKLPPFYIGSYSEALKLAKEQIKILMVVLTSREHGDIEHFRKKTLVDEDLVELVSRPDFIVWGGDVCEREAYQVATQLEATTYPFVAFIALQPSRAGRRVPSSQSSSASLTPRPAVLSRLEGSPMSATSAQSISSHIADVLLPRTRSYLDRLRSERRRREVERELKVEQDRAYEEASRRDAEKVAKKREERQRTLELERQRREQAEKEAQQKRRQAWLAWAKRHLVPDEPKAGESGIRLAFRLPGGRNLSRTFRATDRLESVFAFVEAYASSLGGGDEGSAAAAAAASSPPSGYEHRYEFSLVLGYPRKRIGPEMLAKGFSDGGKRLSDIDGLAPSANLIVEGKVGLGDCDGQDNDSSDSDDDGDDV